MKVSNPPSSPTLLFDGDCGFCRKWVARLAESASGYDTRPCQQSLADFPEIEPEACTRSVQLIDTTGKVTSGADAAFTFWSASSQLGKIARWSYDAIPGFAWFSESLYRLVAHSRAITSLGSRICWGEHILRPRFRLSADLFLRSLGLIYFIAFLSLLLQVDGLIGSEGIFPVGETITLLNDRIGLSAVLEYPSVFYLWSTDTSLTAFCLVGMGISLLGVVFPYAWLVWILNWILYLSFVTVGRTFMSFQWDALLLETGFLAIVHTVVHAHGWASGGERPAHRFSASPHPARAISWAYRWLLFRLMFSSGVVKLTSNDAAWWNLTALTRHYETQPLPNIVSWYAHNLPAGFHTFSCAVMFAIELVIPFLFFAPRRLRHIGAVFTVILQLLIILTGNYTFFNLLSMALCLWLIEDAAWPSRVAERFREPLARRATNLLGRLAIPTIAIHLLFSTMLMTRGVFRADVSFPPVVRSAYGAIAPYRILNSYGLFAVMITDRQEIILEGSDDGNYWETYEFYYKPGDLYRAPSFVAPHQPRLDWQMWFAALGPIRNSPWFYRFTQRLLEGSESVGLLLSQNPFPGAPPRYLRARVFDYQFTDSQEKTVDGAWWSRTFIHVFLPPIVRRER